MKSIEVIVPRMLIKHHLPHPEFYGESLVELLNGKVTDVFINEKGHLFTITNNAELIKYLKQNAIQENRYVLSDELITLRSIKQDDLNLVLLWMNHSVQDTNLKYEADDIRLFITHAVTRNSHVFIVNKNNHPIGLTGYDVVDSRGIIDVKIHKKEIIFNHDEDVILSLLLNHIRQTYNVNDFSSLVLDRNKSIRDLFLRNGFVRDEMNEQIATTSGSRARDTSIYRLSSCEIHITESEKAILNEFYQLYPEKLFYYAHPDELMDLDHALKTYIGLVLSKQLDKRNEQEKYGDVLTGSNLRLLIEKYDEIMAQLSGEDLKIAKRYKSLLFLVLDIINRHIKLYEEKNTYRFVNGSKIIE
ncbi:MAG: GNAT family N-acetyltransferase [archaeon]